MAAYAAYTEALRKAGALKGSDRLRPTSSATTVRMANGKAQVLDGPYAESKEQLGGYFLIDVPDLDAAISWAARCPAANHGAVEVRPVWDMRARHSAMTVHEGGARARSVADAVARRSYGKLVAFLAARTRDVAQAEDALAEAFAAALADWPLKGCPHEPGSLADDGRAPEADRWRPPPPYGRGGERHAASARRRVRGGGVGDGDSRSTTRADVRVCASRDRHRHPRAADPADRARPRCEDDRLGLPRVAHHDGQAACAGEGQDP